MTTIIRSKESIVKDMAMKRLESIFVKAKHKPILEKMTKGDIWEQWVDLTARELSDLNKQGYSQRALAVFMDEATKGYADSYLNALASMAPADDAMINQ